MCPTKMLLKSFAGSNTPQTSTCLLFIIVLKKNGTGIQNFAGFMDPLGVISKKMN